MRRSLVGIGLCLLIPFGSIQAIEKAPPSDTPRAVQVAGQPSPLPQLPPSITQEQIKAFLAKQKKKEDYVILNFDNADLRDVISTVSSITGENFILSPGLEARITIHSARKIPSKDVLGVFEAILEVNGMSLVRAGDFYKIVKNTTAKQRPVDVQKSKEPGSLLPGDRPVTQIVPVEYVPAKEVSSVLKSLLSPSGSIIPSPRNNLLIINDTASNIRRLLEILKEIDVNAFDNTRISFFRPKYSDVKTLFNELTEILNALNLSREGVALVPIERINGLIVFSASPSLLKAVEGWIKRLDEEVITGQNIFVYHVQNVKAESIAEVLKTLYKSDDKKPLQRTARPLVRRKKPSGKSPFLMAKSPEYSRVEITVFEPTNTLVILASPGVYKNIQETIKKLDLYPKEVLIEVVIAEVTLTGTDQLGIQWSVLQDLEGNLEGLIQSRSGQTEVPSYTLPPTLGTGSADTSVTAGGLSYLLFRPERFVALLHALASRGRLNILSSPKLLVRDQEEASIEVGSEIPIATSSTQTAETTSTIAQTIEYRTVGIKLKIKPSINDERTVVLDIEQEVSDQLPNVTVGQEGFTFPAFSTRKTKTSIIVPDGQGIVIGGIMKERKEKNYQGVPLLSSIPVLGNLFRYPVSRNDKTELIVFLTPHVVVNRSEADALTK